MGMSAGSFNTREFFHGATPLALPPDHAGSAIAAALRAAGRLLLWALLARAIRPRRRRGCVAVLLQAPGLLAERWFFFAQARHPQNLYYQVVS